MKGVDKKRVYKKGAGTTMPQRFSTTFILKWTPKLSVMWCKPFWRVLTVTMLYGNK